MLPIGLGSRIRVQSKGQGWNQGKGEDGGEQELRLGLELTLGLDRIAAIPRLGNCGKQPQTKERTDIWCGKQLPKVTTLDQEN